MCSALIVDRALMLHQWYSKPEGGSNLLNIDFALYDNIVDAQVVLPELRCFEKSVSWPVSLEPCPSGARTQDDKNRWKFCNYNDNGIGFPRDCGKEGGVGSQWNTLSRGGHKVTWKKGVSNT